MEEASAHRFTLELTVKGMDCAECTRHVRRALVDLPDVLDAEVFLGSERAVVTLAHQSTDRDHFHRAIEDAGYVVVDEALPEATVTQGVLLSRQVTRLTGTIFVVVILVVVVGEWLGLFEGLATTIPMWLGLLAVLAGGFPVFRQVVRASLRRQVTSHTLMTVGVLAAVAVGEWTTALVVVLFMRVGDYVEHFTAERAREAVRGLSELAPQTARVIRDGQLVELAIESVLEGDLVVIRPGEKIPVDGLVKEGQATVDQSAITGEAMPLEAGPGTRVYAASLTRLGHLKVRATHVGRNTTFGRVIQLVQEAEANRGDVQRFADRFSAYFLPIVATIAGLTLILSGDALATAAVLVVACSCSIALATPIAVLASVGAAARAGLMLKGGKYIEALARADVLLIDKTGTLTLGRPAVTDVVSLSGMAADHMLGIAAAAERYSEHPLAEAVCDAALTRAAARHEPHDFAAVPGMGVRATVDGRRVCVGSRRLLGIDSHPRAEELADQGKTVFYVGADGELIGLLAVTDTLRPEAATAISQLKKLGIKQIELLTGDNAQAAAALARQLEIDFRAELLPEDKIAIVKEYQANRRTVVMVGDGVNDAPALAQADVGVAMGAAGADIALEAAHAALMRDDWMLVVTLLQISRRTMAVVKMNLALTAVYNVFGLALAAFGILPPVLAAAMQSIPDLGILANSSRLLRIRR